MDQGGFSLVELMVGMVLGLLLIAGAVSIYLASKRSYVEVEQVAALTENARFAEQILGDSLRHAGFFGEVAASRVEKDPDLSAVTGDCSGPAASDDVTQFVYAGTVDSGNDALGGCIDDGAEGTNVLVIKHVRPLAFSDGPRDGADPNDPTHHDGVIDTPHGLQADKIYVMTNGVSGLMFDGADTPPTITVGGEVPGGTAWEYQYEVFYVRDRDPSSTEDPPLLSRKFLSWNGAAMELETEDLAEGGEDLQILLGYDSTGDGEVDEYKSLAMFAGNWNAVESIEVFMLVRSATTDVQYTNEKKYKVGASTIDPKYDHYRRLLSHTSLSLRNLKLIIRGEA